MIPSMPGTGFHSANPYATSSNGVLFGTVCEHYNPGLYRELQERKNRRHSTMSKKNGAGKVLDEQGLADFRGLLCQVQEDG